MRRGLSLPAMAPVYEAEQGNIPPFRQPRRSDPEAYWVLSPDPTGANSIQVWPGDRAIGAPLASV
jgi:hypothetical protein